MKLIFYFLLLGFLMTNPSSAQEKKLWEELICDTSSIVTSSISIRSVIQTIISQDSLSNIKPQRLLFGRKSRTNNTHWIVIDSERLERDDSLDSLSVQYLKILLPHSDVLYERWEPWLINIRKDFLNKRDSLLREFNQTNHHLELRVISDKRTSKDQQIFLKKGATLANLSFHELGLASDFGIFRNKKYTKNVKYYLKIDSLAQKYHLRWGGNFVGFIDVPHVQYYFNSAELIRNHPYLGIEYDFYYKIYLKRVAEKIALGEENLVEDSKELLVELNNLRKKDPCFCETKDSEQILFDYPENYIENKDVLILVDEIKSVFYVKYPNQNLKKFRIGSWK